MSGIDRKAVARAFGAAVDTYDAAAELQAAVRTELLNRVRELQLEPQVVIDLGAGTGAATAALQAMFPRALVCAVDIAPLMLQRAARRVGGFARLLPWRRGKFVCVGADALRLPFAAGSAQLVFSSLMLQWCEPLDLALAEIKRTLAPRGVFLFSSLGPGTLRELRSAWARVDERPHINDFVDVHDVGAALARAGLVEPVLDVDRLLYRYADVTTLLRSLQAIGARNALKHRHRALTGKAAFAAMCRAYAELAGRAQDIPATWEVVYGCCFGADRAPQRSAPVAGAAGEIFVAVKDIRRR